MQETQTLREQIAIDAPPQAVFAVWARVADWPLWDPDTAAATLDGPVQVGARGTLTPRQGRRVAMVIDEVVSGARLRLHCPVLGSALHFDHRVQAAGHGCIATHEVAFSGWLAPLLRATVGRTVRRGLPVTMASLKRFVETGR